MILNSPLKAYILTIFILFGFCLGYDVPTSREDDPEKNENGNVTTLVKQYEETISATDGSNSKPLLERLPNGSITGRNRFKTS